MTKPVEGVSERILSCAMEEFLEKGYSDASLRTIAAKAGTTTGSIYSRFKDKEDLFSAIVGPVADYLLQIFTNTQEEFHAVEADKQPIVMVDYVTSGTDAMINYIYDHFEETILLVEASNGTKYQDFIDCLAQLEAEYTYKFMETVNCHNDDLTEEFTHIATHSLLDSMFEIVRHHMDKEAALKYAHMLERYHHAGWNAILKFK